MGGSLEVRSSFGRGSEFLLHDRSAACRRGGRLRWTRLSCRLRTLLL
ncbi:hypothetical protein [Paraeggerthella sp.]